MNENGIKREKTFSEELPYFKERIKEVFDNYSNPNGNEDPLYICVLRDSKRVVRKAEEEITRQQSENKRLGKEVDLVSIQFQDLQERYEEAQAEIEKLNAENTLTISERNAFRTSFYDVLKQLKTAKSESVKEFAERLCEDRVSNDPVVIAAKCLLKEMVGDDK